VLEYDTPPFVAMQRRSNQWYLQWCVQDFQLTTALLTTVASPWIPYIVLFLLYMSKTNQRSFALLYCSTPKLDTACKLGHQGETKGDISSCAFIPYDLDNDGQIPIY